MINTTSPDYGIDGTVESDGSAPVPGSVTAGVGCLLHDPNDEHYIELGDGTFWYPGRDDNEFSIDAMARSVAKLCRFTGHTRDFYSVAEHLVKASWAAEQYSDEPAFALEALVHDLHEGLVNDLSRPVKYFIGGTYKELEDKAETELRRYLGLPKKMHPNVKDIDIKMCLIEAQHLMPSQGKHWTYYDDYREGAFELLRDDPTLAPHCWPWRVAYKNFMQRFEQLGGYARLRTRERAKFAA